MKSVLLYRLGSLGDTLLALPALHVVRRRFPDARIVALTNRPVHAKAPAMSAVLEGTGLIDESIDYPIGLRGSGALFRLRRQIARRTFDCAVNLAESRGWRKSARDHLFLRSCGIARVVGTPWRRADLECLFDSQSGLYEWEAERLARRVASLGKVDLRLPESWDMRFSAAEVAAAHGVLARNGIPDRFLAISVGTKVDSKDWTEPNWLALGRMLSDRFPETAVVGVGSPEEHARTERFLQPWRGPKLNLCGAAGVRLVAAILGKARVFLGHDSGPMHLAATVGVPCVAIFAARNLPGQWYPRGGNNTIFYHMTDCFGCGLEICGVHDKKCIRAIPVSEVAAALGRYLRPATPKTTKGVPCVA